MFLIRQLLNSTFKPPERSDLWDDLFNPNQAMDTSVDKPLDINTVTSTLEAHHSPFPAFPEPVHIKIPFNIHHPGKNFAKGPQQVQFTEARRQEIKKATRDNKPPTVHRLKQQVSHLEDNRAQIIINCVYRPKVHSMMVFEYQENGFTYLVVFLKKGVFYIFYGSCRS